MEDLNTEDKIVNAAEAEFIERGYSGARMQAIADKAGINKALLHYYFRSKEKLFEVIFKLAIKMLIPKFIGIITSPETDFFDKIRYFLQGSFFLVIFAIFFMMYIGIPYICGPLFTLITGIPLPFLL